jgi:hypothetical protein
MRNISHVLNFRDDLSPFLVHLTRPRAGVPARDFLQEIIETGILIPGSSLVSDARFGMRTYGMAEIEKRTFFSALCLTETPLNEIHCLLELQGRQINLEPYGLVFLKDALRRKGVSPVVYLNNYDGSVDDVVGAICSLTQTDETHLEAALLLPLIAVFGQKIQPPGVGNRPGGEVDFTWEREWRFPAIRGHLKFGAGDVFVGVCPHDEIEEFERLLPGVDFVDPRRNMKWYASKLIEARQRLDIRSSVV